MCTIGKKNMFLKNCINVTQLQKLGHKQQKEGHHIEIFKEKGAFKTCSWELSVCILHSGNYLIPQKNDESKDKEKNITLSTLDEFSGASSIFFFITSAQAYNMEKE